MKELMPALSRHFLFNSLSWSSQNLPENKMNEKFKTLKFIHLAICGGAAMAMLTAADISVEKLQIPDLSGTNILFLVLPFAAVIGGNFIFRSQLKKISKTSNVDENLAIYQTASIMRWAILEGVIFVCIFAKPEFAIFGIALLAWLAYLHPTDSRIANDLEITNNHQ